MNRILVVEDDPQLQLLYRSVLERAGFSVITALNGEDALKKLEAYRINHYRYHDAENGWL